VEKKPFSIACLDQSTYTFLIFGRPDSLQCSRISCKPIFNRQKAFFIITNNVEGFLLRLRKAHGSLDPSKSQLQAN
jgi:hypothetical protein